MKGRTGLVLYLSENDGGTIGIEKQMNSSQRDQVSCDVKLCIVEGRSDRP